MKKTAILIMFVVCISTTTNKLFASNMYVQEACYVEHNKEYENYKTASKDSTIVTGRVIYESIGESLDGLPIAGTTVVFYDKKDAEVVLKGYYDEYKNLDIAGSYTKEDGTFEIKLPYGEYVVQFSFIGVDEIFESIFLNTKVINLGDIILKPSSREEFNDIKVTRIKRRDRKK